MNSEVSTYHTDDSEQFTPEHHAQTEKLKQSAIREPGNLIEKLMLPHHSIVTDLQRIRNKI